MSRWQGLSPDVAIVGGGPSGAAAAIGLAHRGVRVLLLERDHAPHFTPGEIVEPTIRHALVELGVDGRFEALGSLAATGSLSLWGSDRATEADAILNPHGCGYLVDRGRLGVWLLEEARHVGVRVEQGAHAVRIQPSDCAESADSAAYMNAGASCLRIDWAIDGRALQARAPFIVDATGRDRGVIGPSGRRRFDRLVGLLAYVSPDRWQACDASPDCRISIEATPHGWWYSAPLPDGRRVIAFMTDADLVPVGATRQAAWFRERLADTRLTRSRLPDGQEIPYVRVCTATSTRRDVIAGPRWVAIGDAASTYDPLTGRGVAAAVSKGTALARLLGAYGSTDAGLARATSEYAEAECAGYDDYLAEHRAIYARERRWPGSPFWLRRH